MEEGGAAPTQEEGGAAPTQEEGGEKSFPAISCRPVMEEVDAASTQEEGGAAPTQDEGREKSLPAISGRSAPSTTQEEGGAATTQAGGEMRLPAISGRPAVVLATTQEEGGAATTQAGGEMHLPAISGRPAVVLAATQEEGGVTTTQAGGEKRLPAISDGRERRSQSEPPPSLQRRRERGGTREQSKGSRAAGESRAAESSEKTAASKKNSRTGEDTSPRSSKRAKVGDIEEEEASLSSEHSSTVSSPLRMPYMSCTDELDSGIHLSKDPAITIAYLTLRDKYFGKCRNQEKLVTLDVDVPRSCLDEYIDEAVQDMILKVARVVFSLSSYIDDNLLNQTSGFLIDWDKESKIGTILTSALLIRSKCTSWDEWSGTDEYAPHAEVRVRLLDRNGTPVIAELVHYHKHYNFALYKLKIDLDTPIPTFCEVKYGQEVFVLGRDDKMHLIVDHGTVPYKGPSTLERHHYMFARCEATEVYQFAPGGPVVDLSGQFLGMVNRPELAFTPSAIIHKCLHMMKKFDYVPRLQIGMKLSSIKFLDLIHKEKIIRECGIGIGLIVTEVSEGSAAEKEGIRIGDIIECWNGKSISTVLELESLLLHMSEEHLESYACNGSKMDVSVGIYRVRKDSRRTKMLSVKLGDDAEVIVKGKHDVCAAHCAMVSNDDVTSGKHDVYAAHCAMVSNDDVASGQEDDIGPSCTKRALVGGNLRLFV